MAYIDSTQEIKDNPYGKRLMEGWQLVRINSVRLYDGKNGKSVVLDIENEYGEYGTIWLDNSQASRPRIAKLEMALGLAHGPFMSAEEAHEFYEEHCKDKEIDVLVGWSKDGTKSYVNEIDTAAAHDPENLQQQKGESDKDYKERFLANVYAEPKEESVATVAEEEKPVGDAKVPM